MPRSSKPNEVQMEMKGCLNPNSDHEGPVAADELETWATLLDQLKGDFLALAEAAEELDGGVAIVRGWTKAKRGYDMLLTFVDNTETAIFKTKQKQRRKRRP